MLIVLLDTPEEHGETSEGTYENAGNIYAHEGALKGPTTGRWIEDSKGAIAANRDMESRT